MNTVNSYSQINTIQKTDSIKIITVKVGGITCGHDLTIIKNNVEKKNGILTCTIIGKPAATSSFEIKYNPSIISLEAIYREIENSPSCDYPDQKPYKVKK